ncbi:MAG TPA: hypothetical protein VES65_11480 [Solirubrobacteraceae bacterium]|nr:hypothetical protein [Solirubrobacteraceae bacterium]
MAAASPASKAAASAAWKTAPLVSGVVASREALAPLAFGEAPRIGILGDSGTGKTEAARALVKDWITRVPSFALVLDDKELRARFEGQERRDLADLAAQPPAPEPRVLVLRGDVRRGVEVDPEEAAAWAWAMAARNRASLVVYDELTRAARNGRWLAGRDSLFPKTFGQGRAAGLSSIWGTQSPQDAPREPFEQSSVIYCFRLDGLGLNTLVDRNYVLDEGLAEVIRSLPGDELPPPERGYFVLLRRGRPWDGNVYRYSAS